MTVIEIKKKTQDQNKDIVRRMREGDPLSSFDPLSSWFPPRPIIRKDEDALKRIFESGESR